MLFISVVWPANYSPDLACQKCQTSVAQVYYLLLLVIFPIDKSKKLRKQISNSYPRFLGAIHKECPHIRGRGGSGKSGQMPNVDVRLEINYSYYICEIYSDNLVVCLYMMSCLCHACLTFTSWSTPSFGMLLWKLFFLPFSVNCSQVAMFQIMPALCPHGQGEVG